MFSLVNGQQSESIPLADRGFQYGDGCFETVRICKRKPVLLPEHLKRLRDTCLKLGLDFELSALLLDIDQALSSIESADSVLKITITRGGSKRGYKPQNPTDCTRVVQLFNYDSKPANDNGTGVSVFLCQQRISSNPDLAGLKHLNRLDQVLASNEIPQGYAEGLCADQDAYIIEGCKSNLIAVIQGELLTPDLTSSGVNGVMLQHLKQKFAADGQQVKPKKLRLEDLLLSEELFLCNSVFGVWPVIKLSENGTVHSWSVGSKTQQAIQTTHEIFSTSG